jgi:hypothetical protein
MTEPPSYPVSVGVMVLHGEEGNNGDVDREEGERDKQQI